MLHAQSLCALRQRVNERSIHVAEFFPALTEAHRTFVERQPVFFVATAAEGTRINLSPKGYDAFRVLAPDRVAYLDLGGSGNETHAHLAAEHRPAVDHDRVVAVEGAQPDR